MFWPIVMSFWTFNTSTVSVPWRSTIWLWAFLQVESINALQTQIINVLYSSFYTHVLHAYYLYLDTKIKQNNIKYANWCWHTLVYISKICKLILYVLSNIHCRSIVQSNTMSIERLCSAEGRGKIYSFLKTALVLISTKCSLTLLSLLIRTLV